MLNEQTGLRTGNIRAAAEALRGEGGGGGKGRRGEAPVTAGAAARVRVAALSNRCVSFRHVFFAACRVACTSSCVKDRFGDCVAYVVRCHAAGTHASRSLSPHGTRTSALTSDSHLAPALVCLLQAQYIERRKYYEEKGLWDIDRAKPVPDKQQNGLLVGSAAIRAEEELQQRLRQRRQGAAAAAAIEAPAADEAAVQAVPAVAAVAGGRESVAEVPVIKHVDTLAAGGQPAVQTPVAEQGGAPER